MASGAAPCGALPVGRPFTGQDGPDLHVQTSATMRKAAPQDALEGHAGSLGAALLEWLSGAIRHRTPPPVLERDEFRGLPRFPGPRFDTVPRDAPSKENLLSFSGLPRGWTTG